MDWYDLVHLLVELLISANDPAPRMCKVVWAYDGGVEVSTNYIFPGYTYAGEMVWLGELLRPDSQGKIVCVFDREVA